VRLSQCSFRDAYWTIAQVVAHQASNGCNLQPGDLLASGTISGTEPGSAGSLLELSQGGRQPIALPGGETRAFIADGDLVVQRGRCEAEGAVPIGFGEAAGLVRPAPK
jgi:fumarylacetoacetase